MFNVFSSAFADNNNAKNPNTSGNSGLTGPISGISGPDHRPMGLKDRLATVRNVQNLLNKKNINKLGTENEKRDIAEKKTGGLLGLKSVILAEPKKLLINKDSNLNRFKNYTSIVNEKQNEKTTNNENEEDVDKKLKKRKRRKKHEIMMERMKQQEKEKGKQGNEDDDEEQENNAADEEEEREDDTNKQRYSNVSQNKYSNQHEEEEEEEEENEHQKEETGMSKDFDSFNNENTGNNNNNINNNNNEPVKRRRGRRKKSEMEELRANKDKNENKDSFKNNMNNTGSFNNATGNGEPQVKRKRGRPKLNATNTDKTKSDQLKTYDIRKFCSKNDDSNETMKKANSIKENEKQNVMNGKTTKENNDDGDNRSIFKIIQTSVNDKDKFMKKSPTEIVQLEKNFRYNIKRGITCIPLHYHCDGGGMAIIIVEADSSYGPVRNGNGFMTFLVLECDANSLFIDTGMKSNVIECEKHMQLLVSPGDTYMLKNKSPEFEARILLIVCNKMKHMFDPAKDINSRT